MKNYLRELFELFFSLLLIDVIFNLIAFSNTDFLSYLRFILFDLGLSIFICALISFFKCHTRRIIELVIVCVFALYALVELQFKNFVGSFYSFQAVSRGLGGVAQYAFYFITSIKLHYLFVLVPVVLYVLCYVFDKFDYKDIKYALICTIVGALYICASFINLPYSDDLLLVDSYKNHNNHDYLISHIGIIPFFFDDLRCLIVPPEITVILEEEKSEPEIIEEETKVITRDINDDELYDYYFAEENQTLKTIDKYILDKKVAQPNQMTGVFKDHNLIYVLVESFDYMAIDKELTPTLYKMYTEGFGFNNHYTPEYSCGTGDSEYVAMTGQFPLISVCSLYNTKNAKLSSSLATLFKNEGYDTYGFHNWTDQFYPRSELMPTYGVDTYKDFDSLNITALNGWLSDEELFNNATPYVLESDKFFAFYVTCAMHWPYDKDSDLGNRYLNLVNEVHSDYPMDVKRYLSKCIDLDKGLESLLNQLESKGQLENTVICLFADHHPYKFENDVFLTYSLLKDRNVDHGSDLEPLVMYCAGSQRVETDQYCSTLDHVPTIANLFDLNYDPRLYAGNDVFNGDSIVKFSGGSWISNSGYYNVYSKQFVPYVDDVSDEYIANTTKQVSNSIKISQAILESNYFAKRPFVENPKKYE